jgi:hypothetical protein
LDTEKRNLLTDRNVAKSPLNDVKDSKVSADLARLLNLTDRYDAAIKSEKLQVSATQVVWHNTADSLSHSFCKAVTCMFQLSELNLQIKKVEKEVLELKKLDVSDGVLLQKSLETERNVSNLENRLGVVSF